MGVKGRLKDMSLVDIIQVFNAERKSAAIHLGGEHGYARVYLKDGDVVHATYRGLMGTDALYRLLTWKDGEFEVDFTETAPMKTIHESSQNVLLEGLSRLDESQTKSGESRGYVGDLESIGLINKLLELGILERSK
jgi:hypothetical protein